MMMDMIAAWLEIDSETQPEPTWKKLCETVRKINRRRAEVIAQEHQCDCSDCLGIATLPYTIIHFCSLCIFLLTIGDIL